MRTSFYRRRNNRSVSSTKLTRGLTRLEAAQLGDEATPSRLTLIFWDVVFRVRSPYSTTITSVNNCGHEDKLGSDNTSLSHPPLALLTPCEISIGLHSGDCSIRALHQYLPDSGWSHLWDGLTQNPVTAYDPVNCQRQSSHRLRWPYPDEFSRFQPASVLLKIVLCKPVCRGCRWWCSCCMWEDCRWP